MRMAAKVAVRPPFDVVLMFKILVIQTLNNLSGERAEYLINDRLSFMRFLGLGLSERVRDAKTVWLLQSSAIPTRRRRIFGQDGSHETGRTNRQSCPTRTAMRVGR